MNIKELHELAASLFSKRASYMSLLQEIAENFYPERALFTSRFTLGRNFADNLTTSYPIIARRDLGNSLGAMLRPTAKEWFNTGVEDEANLDNEAREWLQYATSVQRRAMYDRQTMFTRAAKEGDHDFAAFGQCVISTEVNDAANALLYRCWHLADVAWSENEVGQFDMVFRKGKMSARNLIEKFGDKNHADVFTEARKNPLTEFDYMHMVCEADLYDGKWGRARWVSIYYDVTHEAVLEAKPSNSRVYRIPRWQTVSGSQYAYSPAAIAALPDARLIQAMTHTLLEAGEKYTNPPLIATKDAIRGDISMYAGGVTWADAEYDERLGEVLRPIAQDHSGMPLGIDLYAHTKEMITEAFYLNKLAMPQRAPEMTAYEVGQRVQEYIRQALPIFEPMELEYNGGLCEETFELLMAKGAFGALEIRRDGTPGAPLDMPKSLRGREIQFRFESPLHDALERQKGQRLIEGKGLLAQIVDIDPSTVAIIDAKVALRDALTAIGYPAKWLRTEQEVEQAAQAQAQQAQAQQVLGNMQAGADVAATLAKARPPDQQAVV